MQGTIDALLVATLAFVGSHFLLSSEPLRAPLIKALGAQGFQVVYSLVAIGTFVWMLLAYASAPPMPIWFPPVELYWIPVVLMVLSSILLVAGLTTRSPTAMGGEKAGLGPEDPAPGIMRITRHPVLWAVALWAVGHLAANGNLADIVLFTGLLVLSLGGMAHIDQRRERELDAAWGPVKLTTSVIPFAALITRRCDFDWQGIGLWRLLGGLGLYVALLLLHPTLFGVSALPPM